ncbi:uncharacterized protein LOC116843244 isoform X2 [Odontomachus brunneus]|uniref:uncharacterized protein LOC116843244 isoform X2 n=1 Tax=Odontomachus brunneus TaxID=486640 RepID=UPI0013F2A6A8|nr:uncharacterized protein LOC116843244 isoform X2 [Odontomachus brunneus]
MGVKHSIYESPGTLNYYKFSVEEYALVKRIWSEIEINPQNHGSVYFRSFCETYPQYIKFFTLEPKLPMNFDMRTTEKFSKIFEAMGYLLLDFNNKPKQLDRFVGYIAMVHKDMRLNEQDMHRFMLSLLDYLSQTYPKLMTAQCRDAMSKYMESIAKELSKKMEIFRCYDIAQLDVIKQPKLLWGWCKLFVDPLIFRKTKFYWSEWKKQWDARLDEWAAQDNSAALDPTSQMNDEDTVAASKADDDNEVEVGILQQQRASMITRRTDSDVSASRLAHSTSTILEVIPAGAAAAAAATAAVLSHFCAAIILCTDAIEINWCDLSDDAAGQSTIKCRLCINFTRVPRDHPFHQCDHPRRYSSSR